MDIDLCGRTVAVYAVPAPENVAVNEILVRPAGQEG
jgi:hypothetical protein